MKQHEKRPSVTLSMMINIVLSWLDQSSLSTTLPTFFWSDRHENVPLTCAVISSEPSYCTRIARHQRMKNAQGSLHCRRRVARLVSDDSLHTGRWRPGP